MPATVTIDGVIYTAAEPVQSAPVHAGAASPFAAAGITGAVRNGKAPAHPLADAPESMRLAWDAGLPTHDAQRFAREAARVGRFPRYSCTADTVLATDGGTLTVAAHGFWRPAESGAACKGNGCTGKVA